ncbi:nickel pincer cofactor biosynthesis protein LarB [Magnetovirga frankeli]|nr:nickel pincer cofactor biosynthesis protein LarB [gamma proteobacterium SS-5]
MEANSKAQIRLDFDRAARTGLDEAVFCIRKSPAQISAILEQFQQRGQACLLTRLESTKFQQLSPAWQRQLDYDPLSASAILGQPPAIRPDPARSVAIVSGGTSDAPVCAEVARTLAFYGVACQQFQDVGVTGLWRLLERIEEIRQYPIVIAVAGMEGAIFSVLGGLIDSVLIAVPCSVSYGVGPDGELALHAALGSCAPGILSCNIDNGYGAACAALRILHRFQAG